MASEKRVVMMDKGGSNMNESERCFYVKLIFHVKKACVEKVKNIFLGKTGLELTLAQDGCQRIEVYQASTTSADGTVPIEVREVWTDRDHFMTYQGVPERNEHSAYMQQLMESLGKRGFEITECPVMQFKGFS
jgi:quinol monooxygenase YgiN